MNKKLLFLLASFATVVLFTFQACKYKRDYQVPVDQNQYNTANQVTASFYGMITDEAGVPIVGATVTASGYSTYTDINGVYFFNKINTPRDYTAVVASKPGYFTGYRSIVVNANQKHEIRIALIKKADYQSYIASAGGTIQHSNGFSITFPPDGVENAQTGLEYDGLVYVYTKHIDPRTDMGRNLMPGDMKGNNRLNEVTLLRSMGIVHVELFDVSGNPLRMREKLNATINLTVPPSLLSKAPSTISMWHFDTQKSIWQETSFALLQGNVYSGSANPMSFWTFAVSEPTIPIQMTFMDQHNFPLTGYTVKVINTGKNDIQYALTNGSGWSSIYAYPNASLIVELYANSFCSGLPVFTKTISTTGFTQNFGTYTIPVSNPGYARIIGTLVDCGKYPIGDGAIFVEPIGLFIVPNNLGQFALSLPCAPTGQVAYNAYNFNSSVFGVTIGSISPGENLLGNIIACDVIDPYLNITLTNTLTNQSVTTNFAAPLDNIYSYLESPLNTSFASIVANSTANGKYVQIQSIDSTAGKKLVTDGILTNIGGTFTDTAFTIIAGNISYNGYPIYPGDIVGTFILNVKGMPSGTTYSGTGDFRAPRFN